MAENINTLTNLSVENQEFYDRALIERLLPELHFYKDADKKSIPRGKGTSIEFRKFNSLSLPAGALTEGVTPKGNKLNITKITATAEQYGDYIATTDVIDMQAKDPVVAENSQLCGEQAALMFDTVIRDIVTKGTNVQYANAKATRDTITAADVLTGKEVRKAVRRLKKMNVQTFEDGCYHMIIDADQEYDLKEDTTGNGFVEVMKYAKPENLLSGEIGKYAGTRIMVSSNIESVDNSNSVSVHKAVIYGKHAYGVVDIEKGNGKPGVIVKPLGSSGTEDPLNQRATVGWKNMFTAVRFNEASIVRIETGASAE